MLLGNIREGIHSNCRTSQSSPHITHSFSTHNNISNDLIPSSTNTSQQTMMNYARMSYRYTTFTLLSLRPKPNLTIFPDHLVERRFLDDENYIDLDRMLAEKGGQFQHNSYGMYDGAGDGPVSSNKLHKHDFSDPIVIEKVKNRRPKDSLTPHQVAALTSVMTRHQPSILPEPLFASQPIQLSHGWADDNRNRHAHIQRNTHQCCLPAHSAISIQQQNLNQYHSSKPQMMSTYPIYRSYKNEQNMNSIPILQRLFQAQQHQQKEHLPKLNFPPRNPSSNVRDRSIPYSPYYNRHFSPFSTPTSPQQQTENNTFSWPFSTNQNEKCVTHPLQIPMSTQKTVKNNQDVFYQLINDHVQCSTIIQTPVSPSFDISETNNYNKTDTSVDADDDELDFYSAPPSPIQQQKENVSTNPEQTRIYNQAVVLNSLIQKMVHERDIQNSASRESCSSNDTHSTSSNQENNETYAEMYNLIRLLSPGVKNVAQQELLQYLERGCLNERDEFIRSVSSLDSNEQNSLKQILLNLISEQLDIMKRQKHIQQGDLSTIQHQRSQDVRSPLESWFGCDIYNNAYPCMPSDRVVSACDLEQIRSTQQN